MARYVRHMRRGFAIKQRLMGAAWFMKLFCIYSALNL